MDKLAVDNKEPVKFIRIVCPQCLYETRSPNNFWNVIKFWKYETAEVTHTDPMDCIRHLNRRINELSRSRANPHVCPHCPHCTPSHTMNPIT